MARERYFLFVDEVKPTGCFDIYNFTGVAIKAINYGGFKKELNSVKNSSIPRLGGEKVNLHFSHLINRKKDTIFEKITYNEEKMLWNGLGNLFDNTDFHILSGIVDESKHNAYYKHYRVKLETLAFKVLIQNFVRYLHMKNGYGEVIVESSCDDEKLREEYYISKFTGGKYITSEGYNLVLRGIEFISKEKLYEGLQLADFIANPVSRLICNMGQFKIHKFYTKSYEDIIKPKIFDGEVSKPYEFGLRKIYV